MMKNIKYSENNSSSIPYGRQWIDEDDIQAVVDVLRSDWITTGPKVAEFEQALADFVGAKETIAVSSGTAALHAAMYAIGIGPGDEVILPPMTFAATANAVVFQGGTPVFADVDPETLLIDPAQVEGKISPCTKAIIAVDYAGQPCDYDALRSIADKHNLFLVADACHSLGAIYKEKNVGTLADLTIFSFHPVKHITTGEGGIIITEDTHLAKKIRNFRNHGIEEDHNQRVLNDTWHYEIQDIGYNYRITDFQCALGISQLKKLPKWIARRQAIAKTYDYSFSEHPIIQPLHLKSFVLHSYHLYVVCLNLGKLKVDRGVVFKALRKMGIGVNVHYIPVYLHPFYRSTFSIDPGLCPIAERIYQRILSLPIFPHMSEKECQMVIESINKVSKKYYR